MDRYFVCTRKVPWDKSNVVEAALVFDGQPQLAMREGNATFERKTTQPGDESVQFFFSVWTIHGHLGKWVSCALGTDSVGHSSGERFSIVHIGGSSSHRSYWLCARAWQLAIHRGALNHKQKCFQLLFEFSVANVPSMMTVWYNGSMSV